MMTFPTIDLNEIHSLTDFVRNTKTHARRLKRTKQPAVLTVNGRAELVVQDAASYRELLLRIRAAEDLQAVQEGLVSFENGQGRPMDEVFDELERKFYGPKQKPALKRS
jgi:hypothetical protein